MRVPLFVGIGCLFVSLLLVVNLTPSRALLPEASPGIFAVQAERSRWAEVAATTTTYEFQEDVCGLESGTYRLEVYSFNPGAMGSGAVWTHPCPDVNAPDGCRTLGLAIRFAQAPPLVTSEDFPLGAGCVVLAGNTGERGAQTRVTLQRRR